MLSALLTRPICLVGFLECEFTDRKGKTCRSTRTHYPDSAPTSLMMDVYWKNIKYQYYYLWFNPNITRTHDVPTLFLNLEIDAEACEHE